MELTYRKEGDYLLPNIQAPKLRRSGNMGCCGTHFCGVTARPMLSGLQLNGKLNEHLEQIDRQANEMMETLMERDGEIAGSERRTQGEQPNEVGSDDEQHRASAEETVLKDIVYS